MSNPFQEQLLKAGLVSKQQVDKVNKDKRKKKRQPGKRKAPVATPDQLRAQQAAATKAERDRELNQRRQDQARLRALSNEINDLVRQHRIERDKQCELPYNFAHQGKVKRIYINEALKQQILQGKLGIARIEGTYELVPASIARKIQQRNDKRVVLFDADGDNPPTEDDPYADYRVPDDLMW